MHTKDRDSPLLLGGGETLNKVASLFQRVVSALDLRGNELGRDGG